MLTVRQALPASTSAHADPRCRVLQAFPMRDQHFFASVDKAMADLDWKPEFGLVDGLKDSYDKDFGLGQCRKEADFEVDDMILAKLRP
jgi:nucleoside-diphosphate-sugar epimerase